MVHNQHHNSGNGRSGDHGMMHSPLVKIIAMLAWLLSALAAIHLGLLGIGINLWESDFVVRTLPWLMRPAHYIFGIAGLISLIMFVMSLTSPHCCRCR